MCLRSGSADIGNLVCHVAAKGVQADYRRAIPRHVSHVLRVRDKLSGTPEKVFDGGNLVAA
jgi:hypothetical protein